MRIVLKNQKSIEAIILLVVDSLPDLMARAYIDLIIKLRQSTLADICGSRREWWLCKWRSVTILIRAFCVGWMKDSIETRDGNILHQLVGQILSQVTEVREHPKGSDFLFVVERNGVSVLVLMEMKTGPNWPNKTSLQATREKLITKAKELSIQYGMVVIPVIGVCSASLDGKPDEFCKDGVFHIFGRLFWNLVTGYSEIYDQVFPIMGEYKETWDEQLQALPALKAQELLEETDGMTVEELISLYKPATSTSSLEEAMDRAMDEVAIYPSQPSSLEEALDRALDRAIDEVGIHPDDEGDDS